jgi:uncharacterized beta-barrel protein YwiB (DUF1934 family)
LEVIFIKIKVKGYLKNITDNEIIKFDEKGIKNNNKVTYCSDNIKHIVRINDGSIMLIREGNEFINTFVFNKNKSSCNYFLKESNYDVDIDIKTIIINCDIDSIYIRYIIMDSNCEYEYKLEMSEI